MDIRELQILVGYLCTSIFMLSRVPMLLKAVRTRDLRSYSFAHLAMSTCANLLFWIYVVALPFGPVWILQIFFTVTDLSMLTLCVSQRRQLSKGEGYILARGSSPAKAELLSVSQANQIGPLK